LVVAVRGEWWKSTPPQGAAAVKVAILWRAKNRVNARA
jgi:hypothetical protein